ncbi:4'-phosphopantetheinyl transferase superfamily protein [Acuticoccus sp. I52.16.1]|uniref:4'-phosphopantetheinyl transferase family protein n=1 Tax=Acuticoccus sp. I52.16.1 TaxID=2928472 RepID=UPI001FD4EB14|nr:4'-phosphopantetheinyl transferase superfamily protein [Acuticoccus sp. I52.16.1]UOM34323.1 4'-phosphopantetheinyl transferase superfamily protein [Acuticoccus sp. I52.16.1]
MAQSPPPDPAAARATVEVLHVDLAALGGELGACAAVLSPDERARAERYAFPRLKRRFVLRRGMLRRAIAARIGVPAAGVAFVEGAQGKPALVPPAALHFNLTDTEDDVVVALCATHPVGVDAERRRRLDDGDGVARHIMGAAEFAAYGALAAARRPDALMRVWTAKEAVVKALGTGLSRPLESIEVRVAAHGPARLLRLDGDDAARWSLHDLALRPGLQVTLALRCADARVTLRPGREAALDAKI